MDYLFKNKVNDLLDKSNINSNSDFISNMVEMFYEETISETDKKLLALAFKNKITQEDLDTFIVDWDIEAYGGSKALMLAYIKNANPHLEFSEYEGPRLKGLLSFFRFANLKIIAHFTKFTRELNKKNITPLLIKGGAMKHLRQELPRVMGDTDIVTLGKDFDVACELAKDMGYDFGIKSNSHSVDLHPAGEEGGAVDIHKFIDFDTEYDKKFMKELFQRGTKIKAFGADAILPCAEDLVFIGLSNLSKNLHRKTSSHGILYMLFDCKFLISSKPDFNWDIVLNNAIKTNSIISIYFAMKFLNKLVPGLLPQEIFEHKALEKEVERYCNKVIYFRFFVHDLKMRCKKLKIKDAIKSKEVFKQYAKDKPKHFILKRVNKNHVLIALYLKLFNK